MKRSISSEYISLSMWLVVTNHYNYLTKKQQQRILFKKKSLELG